jgi:transposase
MPPRIEFPLDIPEVRIIETELGGRAIVIRVESTREWAICHKCGEEIREFHGYGEKLRLRHLPILGREVYIEIRPKRYRCPKCDDHPTSTQQLDWYDARSPNTKAYDKWLMLMLIGSTISDVMRKESISYDVILGALQRQIVGSVNWREFSELSVLGLDEIALKKGHKDYVVLVTSRKDGQVRLLGVLPDRKKATVVAFLRQIPVELRATIEDVCTDIFDGYINAVKEEITQARIVIDRFHVAKLYHECADKLRKQALRELKEVLTQEEYTLLKGTMWPFRHNPADLTQQEQLNLDLLLECAPDLKQAYLLREELTQIFEAPHDKTSATMAINQWIKKVQQSQLSCFDSFLTTLDNWLDEITNYFVARLNSGFVEGFNNKVKVLKRRCFGITNLKHLFQRLSLDLVGYDLFGFSTTLSGGYHFNS